MMRLRSINENTRKVPPRVVIQEMREHPRASPHVSLDHLYLYYHKSKKNNKNIKKKTIK